jgi:predicted DNA-binding antitoxin AbrB/MazE fold protein
MLSVEGTFHNGVVYPKEPIEGREGQSVIIMLVESNNDNSPLNNDSGWDDTDWDEFESLLERCATDTGVEDLAHQHDHYIHGTPKRGQYP